MIIFYLTNMVSGGSPVDEPEPEVGTKSSFKIGVGVGIGFILTLFCSILR